MGLSPMDVFLDSNSSASNQGEARRCSVDASGTGCTDRQKELSSYRDIYKQQLWRRCYADANGAMWALPTKQGTQENL